MTTKLSVHVFTWDGEAPDFHGNRYCTCHAIETHPRHEVPPISQDEREVEARLMGEGAQQE